MSQRHRPRKRFGQHFLTDETVVTRIAQACARRGQQTIIEIGPGEGALTTALLDAGLAVRAIEVDRDLVPRLRKRFAAADFEVVEADVLNVELHDLGLPTPYTLCGNLPYNISSPLLFHLARSRQDIESMTFMLQKEVVERVLAQPGGGDYGRLSIMLQLDFVGEHLFDVAPEAFDPPPAVESSVMQLVPSAKPVDAALRPALERLLREAFAQRRKTLRNTLKRRLSAPEIDALGIDPGARPETLGIDQWLLLAGRLEAETSAQKKPDTGMS